MNQTTMIEEAARRAGLNRKQMREAWIAIANVITETVTNGEPVSITNFGTFAPHDKPEREAWNPSAQVHMQAPAVRVIRFKASRTLQAVVAGRSDRDTLRKRSSRVPGPRKEG